MSLTSSSFLPLETWYNFIFWLPCCWVEPCGQLWPMNWSGSEECSFRTESLIGQVVDPSKESTCQCRRWGFPGGSEVKASASNVGDPGSIPGSGRSPGEGNGNPLLYSCLKSPMDRGAWQATVHGVSRVGHDLATKLLLLLLLPQKLINCLSPTAT